MNLAADNIRVLAASMVERAKSGHPGGAMGGADFINVLYSEFLQFDPDNATWRCRDRFFLDPGHMSPMLYSQLALIGNYSIEDLMKFRQWGSPTPGHPEVCFERGIENTSGPLGQGHTYAVGAAIAAKALYARTGNPGFDKEKIYAYISDGGVQEEISQGAGRIAGHLGLNNLIMFFDANEIQLSTETAAVISEDTGMKYRAWNWNVLEIDGNDCEQIRQALAAAQQEENRPTLIIGHCVMGKGCRKADNTSYERNCKTHGAPLGGDAYVNTIKNLGADPENPFVIRPEVAEMYEERKNELRALIAERKAEEKAWEEANPEKAAQLNDWMAGRLPHIPWEEIQQKPNSPTRNGSSACLALLSQYVPNMIVSSADLCNSDKTDGFLAHSTEITRTNFAGGFLQAGVSELTMACVCIGMMLHGGIITAMGTFFVFSDYMKPAIRQRTRQRAGVPPLRRSRRNRMLAHGHGEHGHAYGPDFQPPECQRPACRHELQRRCGTRRLRGGEGGKSGCHPCGLGIRSQHAGRNGGPAERGQHQSQGGKLPERRPLPQTRQGLSGIAPAEEQQDFRSYDRPAHYL